MYSKSLGDENHNYFDTMCLENLERIAAHLPYNPALANLSMTSKNLRLKVLETPCGEYVRELDALSIQPSYLRVFFAKDNGIKTLIGGYYLGAAIGAYLNYDTIFSTYVAAVTSGIVGAAVSCAISGYVIDDFKGSKIAISNFAGMLNLMPWAKLLFKGAFPNIIEEKPVELMEGYCKDAQRFFNFFEESNRAFRNDLQKKALEIEGIPQKLSQPITEYSGPK